MKRRLAGIMSRAPANIAPNRGRKSAYRPPACIFCGGPKPTLEHGLPEWTQKYVPATNPTASEWANSGLGARLGSTGEPVALPPQLPRYNYRIERQGDPAHLKFFGPCADCNNRWMSRIEVEAETVLAPILRDEPHTISTAAQAVLAKWVTLRSIVVEMGWPELAAFSPARRREFMERPGRFPTSRVYIGRSLDQKGKGFYGSTDPLYIPELQKRVSVGLYAVIHLGPLIGILLYIPEPICDAIPALPAESFSFPPAVAHLLREVSRAPDALPINWPLSYAIQHPRPFEDIRDLYKTLSDESRHQHFESLKAKPPTPP